MEGAAEGGTGQDSAAASSPSPPPKRAGARRCRLSSRSGPDPPSLGSEARHAEGRRASSIRGQRGPSLKRPEGKQGSPVGRVRRPPCCSRRGLSSRKGCVSEGGGEVGTGVSQGCSPALRGRGGGSGGKEGPSSAFSGADDEELFLQASRTQARGTPSPQRRHRPARFPSGARDAVDFVRMREPRASPVSRLFAGTRPSLYRRSSRRLARGLGLARRRRVFFPSLTIIAGREKAKNPEKEQ